MLDKLGVSAPDDKTFVVKLAIPATYFLAVTGMWVTVPMQEKWITSKGATETGNYVSSGPFNVESWDHNAQIVLKPNPNWGGTKPTLTEIDMPIFAELADAQRAYEADEVDSVYPIPDEDINRIKNDPAFADQYSEIPTLGIAHYDFNNGVDPSGKGKLERCPDEHTCPTINKDFRIALTEAIDKQAFIDATFSGIGQVANSFIMPGLPGYDESINPYPFEPRRREGAHGHGAAGDRLLECRGHPAAEVRLQHGRRPRAACRLPRGSLEPGLRPQDRPDRYRVQRLPDPADRWRVRPRP